MSHEIKLQAVGNIDFRASGDATKPKTFSMNGYSGAPMLVGGFAYPIIIELGGMKPRSSGVVILKDHDMSKLIGQGTATINAAGFHVDGTITGENADAQEVVTQAKNGFKWQASVGANVIRREFLEHGKTATVNARTINGPAIIARETEVIEVSFVAIGADGNTSAVVAASFFQGMNMDPITATATAKTEAEIRAEERARITDIESLCRVDNWGNRAPQVESLKARAINGELTKEQLQGE